MGAYFTAMRRYATFSGRTSRAEFWRAHTVLLPLILIAFGGLGLPFAGGSRSVWPALLFVLIVAPHTVPWAALIVRRLHDTDVRGWWALVALLPLIPVVPLGIVALLAWACRRGTSGPNRYGPKPLRATPRRDVVDAATHLPTSAQQADVAGQIERLAQLKAAGALSEGEFEVLKTQALAHAHGV